MHDSVDSSPCMVSTSRVCCQYLSSPRLPDHFISRVLQSLWLPAIWLRHHPLRGVDSVRLQILSVGTCRQCGSRTTVIVSDGCCLQSSVSYTRQQDNSGYGLNLTCGLLIPCRWSWTGFCTGIAQYHEHTSSERSVAEGPKSATFLFIMHGHNF